MHVGGLFEGRYIIDAVIGETARSTVLSAHHAKIGSKVALKLLRVTEAADAVARFTRQAQIGVRLTDFRIASMADVGLSAEGVPYIVMDLFDAPPLRASIAREGARPLDVVIDYATQACETLGDAHARGVIHGAINPNHLFAAGNLLGWIGFRVLESDPPTAFLPPDAYEVAYMPPEQLRREAPDRRSDIWSLGVVLSELLEGVRPFPRATAADLAMQIAVDQPVMRLTPPALRPVIETCLQKTPDRRYASAPDLLAALTAAIASI